MASYTSPDISGYNSNPPSDDGTESTSNRIDWSTIKNKLNDPTKTYSEAIDSATTSAFTTVDGQIADGSAWYKADTGAADAYVVTLSPAVTSNVVGRKTSFKATNTNTGASTLNLNAIGAEAIKRKNGNALAAGDIVATRIYTVTWDGTNYIIDVYADLDAIGQVTSALCTATTTFSNTTTLADITGMVISNLSVGVYAFESCCHVEYQGDDIKIGWDLTNITSHMLNAQSGGVGGPTSSDNMAGPAFVFSVASSDEAGAMSIQGIMEVTNATNTLQLQGANRVASAGNPKVYINSWMKVTKLS